MHMGLICCISETEVLVYMLLLLSQEYLVKLLSVFKKTMKLKLDQSLFVHEKKCATVSTIQYVFHRFLHSLLFFIT